MNSKTRHGSLSTNSMVPDSKDQLPRYSTKTASSAAPKPETKAIEGNGQELRNTRGINPAIAVGTSRNSSSKGPSPSRRPDCCHNEARVCGDHSSNKLQDAEILEELGNWIMERLDEPGKKLAHCFIYAPMLPPVTRESLAELDISAMLNNAKLRHDINLDKNLHFRPNFDGEKGREKLQTAEDYWMALTAELMLYNFLFLSDDIPKALRNEPRSRIEKASQRRIPSMFVTIKEILKILVPKKDQQMVDEQFDKTMLMQQIEKGVCDFIALAKWLAQLLKAHCAPIRDAWVDRVVEQIEMGVRTSQSDHTVKALREVLAILEAMKLDVANHQIRHLRPILIDGTIDFEQTHHLHRIRHDRIKINDSQKWFSYNYRSVHKINLTAHQKEPARFRFEVFLRALLELLTSNPPKPFPESFSMDLDRLHTLKGEIEDLVYFSICWCVFKDTLRRLKYAGQPQDSTKLRLQIILFDIVKQTGATSTKQWLVSLDNIAAELVRQAYTECCTPGLYDAQLVQVTGHILKVRFQSSNPNIVTLHFDKIYQLIFPQLLEIAESHLNQSPIDIYNSLMIRNVPPPPPPPPPLSHLSSGYHSSPLQILPPSAVLPQFPASFQESHFTVIAHRIAHIAILHWRIWDPIMYSRLQLDNPSASNLPHISSSATSTTKKTQGGSALIKRRQSVRG